MKFGNSHPLPLGTGCLDARQKILRSVFNIRADVDRTIQILSALIQISLETRELVPQILRLKFGPSDQNFNQFDLI